MFFPIRDALSLHPDRSVRWLAVAIGVLTAGVTTAGVLGLAVLPRTSCVGPPHEGPLPTIGLAPNPLSSAGAMLARATVDRLAFELYPSWVASQIDRACPESLAELVVRANDLGTLDPWGKSYQFLCGAQHGVVGLQARSAGADGVFDTADDLRSDR